MGSLFSTAGQNGTLIPFFDWCGLEKPVVDAFITFLRAQGKESYLRSEFLPNYRRFTVEHKETYNDQFEKHLRMTEEIFFHGADTFFTVRPSIGIFMIYRITSDGPRVEKISVPHYLSIRESIVLNNPVPEEFRLEIDFSPFQVPGYEEGIPELIGKGLEQKSRFLERDFYERPEQLAEMVAHFLSSIVVGTSKLYFTTGAKPAGMLKRVRNAIATLAKENPQDDIADHISQLNMQSLSGGWGKTVGKSVRTLRMLEDLLVEPNANHIRRFFGAIPLIRSVVLVSPHGWFAQSNALGRPDTGGQVVYVLDQARALEEYLEAQWANAGMPYSPKIVILTRLIPNAEGTTCHEKREKVNGSKNCWIVRVPFHEPDGGVAQNWVSRFKIWPYLHRYASESAKELILELGAVPDLIIGNYTDGGVVANLLGREWHVTTGHIGHALEKTKYLYSDLYWRELENDYNFSAHFLADVLNFNSPDFVVASSYQEYGGTQYDMGQYESYAHFTLPACYRVVQGLSIFSSRFEIIGPGVNEEKFFPADKRKKRNKGHAAEAEDILFGAHAGFECVGEFADPGKPAIFSLARMDKIKNLSGLVEMFAQSEALKRSANLIIVSGFLHEHQSSDIEERAQICRLYELIDHFNLRPHIRWLPSEAGQHRVPEMYRLIADRGGVFAQPALFEGFGLTVIEAMACGLPVAATRFGGPLEIIEHNVSGMHIDPTNFSETEKALLSLITDRALWEKIQAGGYHRVASRYRWSLHAEKLSRVAAINMFWNSMHPDKKDMRLRYVDALYHLLLRPLINKNYPVAD